MCQETAGTFKCVNNIVSATICGSAQHNYFFYSSAPTCLNLRV